MSYRALHSLQDYLVIADETTLVYANNELRDHRGVLVPAGEPKPYDTEALDRQNTEFSPRFSQVANPSLPPAVSVRRWPPYRSLRGRSNVTTTTDP